MRIVHDTNTNSSTKMAVNIPSCNAPSTDVLLGNRLINNSLTGNERRKHRYTLFIGYGEESGSLLKRCEQLKCKLGINTNIEFLKYLVEYFEERNPDFKPIVQTGFANISQPVPNTVEGEKCNEQLCATTVSIQQEEEPCGKEIDGSTKGIEGDACQRNYNIKRSLPFQITEEENVKVKKITDVKCLVEHHEFSNEQLLVDNSTLFSSPMSFKAVKIILKYMENVKRDINYYHGFISSTEKLRKFLDEYRQATNTSFTVRSSRSYIKKRALNAVKALKSNTSEQHDLTIGATQILECNVKEDEKVLQHTLSNEILIDTENETSESAFEIVSKDIRERAADTAEEIFENKNDKQTAQEDMFDVNQTGKENSFEENQSLDDSVVTGPLRWEYILGKPPIPFTGVPFFIIGNTQYQCFFATADARTQKRRSEVEKTVKENPGIKPRTRRSLKRDCKAVMCIKSIVSFPEFTVQETISEVKSKKGCRKLKAKTLDKIRNAVEKGESIGHPAFWVYIPLPEAHSTHDLESEADKAVNLENVDEIAQILNAAAQYGGPVQVVQKSGDIVEFQITEMSDGIDDATQQIASQFLCFSEHQEAQET